MIRFNNVNKIYNEKMNNEYHALKNVNLCMRDSGLISVFGKSGSGKSTLLNLISGLDTITNGELSISYKEPYSAFLFQDAQLLEQYTLKENLDLAMDISNNHIDISNYIKKYDLEGLLNHKANELSSGQKMRVSLIRTILENRPVVICDEPTGALDSINSKIIADELKELSKTRLVIVATHDQELFKSLADQIFEIKDGNVEEIYNSNTTSSLKEYSVEASLSTKNIIKFSKKNIGKSKIRYILSCISFTILFTILLCSLSMLLIRDSKAKYKIYKDYDLPYVLYEYKMQMKDGDPFYPEFTYDEAKEESKQKNHFMIVEYRGELIEDISSNNSFYLTDICLYPMLYGNNKINSGEIIISESEAKELSKIFNIKIDNIVGEKVDNFTIVGIYKNYDAFSQPGLLDEGINHNVFINESDFNNLMQKEENLHLDFFINDSTTSESFYIYKNTNLKDNEISVYSGYESNYNNISKLKTYSEKKYTKEIEDYIEYTFTEITYNDSFGIGVSENVYNQYLRIYNCRSSKISIGIQNYTLKDMDNLSKKFTTTSDLEGNIDHVRSQILLLGGVEGGIAVLLGILTIVLLLSYVNISINQSKREIGVLLTMGIKKDKIHRIFIPDCILLLLISFIISIGLGIPLFKSQLKMASDFSSIPLNYGYISIWPFIILLSSALLIATIIIFIMINKIKKKNTIDLIYEK